MPHREPAEIATSQNNAGTGTEDDCAQHKVIDEKFLKQTNGVIPQVVHNPSTEDLHILTGTVTGYATPHTRVPAEEVVGELHTRKKATDTVNSCEQATDTEDSTVFKPALLSPVAALVARLT